MRKPNKNLKSADKEGFLLAYHDLLVDMSAAYDCDVWFTVECTGRRGVLAFTFEAWREPTPDRKGMRHLYRKEYPNAQVGTLEAFLFQSLNSLDRMVIAGEEQEER